MPSKYKVKFFERITNAEILSEITKVTLLLDGTLFHRDRDPHGPNPDIDLIKATAADWSVPLVCPMMA